MGNDGECDECEKILIPGTVVYGCRDCNYDLCDTCRSHVNDPECWPIPKDEELLQYPLEGTYRIVPEQIVHGGFLMLIFFFFFSKGQFCYVPFINGDEDVTTGNHNDDDVIAKNQILAKQPHRSKYYRFHKSVKSRDLHVKGQT